MTQSPTPGRPSPAPSTSWPGWWAQTAVSSHKAWHWLTAQVCPALLGQLEPDKGPGVLLQQGIGFGPMWALCGS